MQRTPYTPGAPLTIAGALVVHELVSRGAEALVSDWLVPAAVTTAAVVLGALVHPAERALVRAVPAVIGAVTGGLDRHAAAVPAAELLLRVTGRGHR